MVGSRKTDAASADKSAKQQKRDAIKKESPSSSRSPSRTKSPGRQKSPSRTKSPSRSKSPTSVKKQPPKSPNRRQSPGRNKSPQKSVEVQDNLKIGNIEIAKVVKKSEKSGRLTPTRRSPIRRTPTKISNAAEDDPVPFLRRRQKIVETDTDSDTAQEEIFEIKEKPKAVVKGRSQITVEKIEGEFVKDSSVASNISSTSSKRLTRSQNREVDRIVHLKQLESVTRKLAEFSDEDDIYQTHSHTMKQDRNLIHTICVLGLMAIQPVIISSVFVLCNDISCSFFKIPFDFGKFFSLSTYVNIHSLLYYLAYVIFIALLSAIPFGGKKVASLPDKQGRLLYNMNGLSITVVTILTIIALEFKGVKVSDFVTNCLFDLFLDALVVGFLVTVYAYIRSFYVPVSALNPQIIGKDRISTIYLGREMHPRLLGIVDLKLIFTRLAYIGMFITDFAYFYKSFGFNISNNTGDNFFFNNFEMFIAQPTVIVYLIIHSIYILDSLIFEHTWVTKESQQEGFGYSFSVGCSIFPFLMAPLIKYITDFNVELSIWKLTLIVLVNLVGYILYRGSNSQRDAFMKNPYNPNFAHMESIPTTQGKKLLCSGFWGLVRHPNHLGEILIITSLIPFVFGVPPTLALYLIVVFLLYQSKRDDINCKRKYGPAWDRYCHRVKYLLVPKIY